MTTLSISGRQFKIPGPVAGSFMLDFDNELTAILGPVGSGKTVTCVHKPTYAAALQPPCRDGIIRHRCVAVRDTYDRLEKTTMATWLSWFPKSIGDWTGGGGRPAKHKLPFETLQGGRKVRIEFEMLFAAIGDEAAEDFARGFETTSFWLNEGDRLAPDVITHMLGRLNRFPKKEDMPEGVTYRSFGFMDLNPPDIDDPFYHVFEEVRPDGFKLYKQPSGLSPRAENLHNLAPGYYDRLLRLNAHRPKWVKRFVHAEYGPSDDGEPVFPEYSDAVHLASHPLEPLPNLPIKLGFDQGIQRPACIIAQRTPQGQYRLIDEVVPGRMGAQRFAEAVRLRIADVAPGLPIERGWADPAGFTGADKQNNEFAWAETVALELGISIMPAPSNEIGIRLDAVRDELTYMIDGNTPALLLSPRCAMLRKGFASHYRYQKQRVGNSDRFADKPEKNDWSNPHDALQYLLLGDKGRYGVIAGHRSKARAGGSASAASQSSTTIKSDFPVF
jgi:hypothetical protein